MSKLNRPWPWALDGARRRYQVGDLVTTTKASWFGPGIAGEVSEITLNTVTIQTGFPNLSAVTVRHYHVLVQERRTGAVARLRRLRREIEKRINHEAPKHPS